MSATNKFEDDDLPVRDTDAKTIIMTRNDVKEPGLFDVIYINDEKTSFAFVAHSLKTVFNYNDENAVSMTNLVHEQGRAVVATYTYEIAEQKAAETMQMARSEKFPLVVKISPSRAN